jgi:hypothetical protein
MSPPTIVGYNTNDFFYVSANNNLMPSENECKDIKNNKGEYTSFNFDEQCNVAGKKQDILDDLDGKINNITKCIKKELCENKRLAEDIQQMQNRDGSSAQRFSDTLSMFNFTLLNTLNMAVGIGIVSYLIYKHKKNT